MFLRTGSKEKVLLEVGSPILRCVKELCGGTTHVNRRVNAYYRSVMNFSELSDDEEIQGEMFSGLPDPLTRRVGVSDEGLTGHEGAGDGGSGGSSSGPDVAHVARRDQENSAGAEHSPEEPEHTEGTDAGGVT
jgi:hypothetical protein